MAIVTFAPVVREGSHAIITAYGFSGCGKTYSLIKLGRGLVGPKGKLGLLDTETGRGKIYAKLGGGFAYAELTAPFTPERYVEAIEAAEEAGIEALIIDSGSHEWEGIGGILEMAEDGTSQSGKPLEGLVKWAKPKAAHKRYVQRLLTSRMHLLIGLRAKEKMRQLTAKDQPLPSGRRIGDILSDGYTPIQDKRFIYETTVQLYLPLADRDHLGIPTVEKCPEDLLGAFPPGQRIDEETGERIAEWIRGGIPVDHAYADLKRDAEAAANNGRAALRDYWRRLDKSQKGQLQPEIDNLGSIAATADLAIEERRKNGHRTFDHAAEVDEDPFGLPPLTEPASPGDPARTAEGARVAATRTPPAVSEQTSPAITTSAGEAADEANPQPEPARGPPPAASPAVPLVEPIMRGVGPKRTLDVEATLRALVGAFLGLSSTEECDAFRARNHATINLLPQDEREAFVMNAADHERGLYEQAQ